LADAGAAMGRAGVAAVYLLHGTFCGNDSLGLLTELSRFAPHAAERMRRAVKSGFDLLLGETGNYTSEFAATLEHGLSAGAGRAIPVGRFNWASHNTHIARADGAVRLIDELARVALNLDSPAPSPSEGRVGEGGGAGTNVQPAHGAIPPPPKPPPPYPLPAEGRGTERRPCRPAFCCGATATAATSSHC
jgi:hypothetical protein